MHAFSIEANKILEHGLNQTLSIAEEILRQAAVRILMEDIGTLDVNRAKAKASELYWMFDENQLLRQYAHLQKQYDWLRLATYATSFIYNNSILHSSKLDSYFVLNGNNLCTRCEKLEARIVKLIEKPSRNASELLTDDPFTNIGVWFGKIGSTKGLHATVPYHDGFCDLRYVAIDPKAEAYSTKYGKIKKRKNDATDQWSQFLPPDFKDELKKMEAGIQLRKQWAANDRKRGIHRIDKYYYEKLAYYQGEIPADQLRESWRSEIERETEPGKA